MKIDKDAILKIIKNNQPIAVLLALLVIIFIIYSVIFVPLIKETRGKYLECRACENQVIDGRTLIKYASGLDKFSGGRMLISEKEAARGIDEFTEHAKSLGIRFISFKPKDVIIKEGFSYKILPIEMDIEADDQQFVKFLGSIDELKRAIVTVEDLEVISDKQDARKLRADMIINIYLSTKESTSEEII